MADTADVTDRVDAGGSRRATVEALECRCYRFPTPAPESDGTFTWSATVAVCVLARADGVTGLGWTYSTPAAAALVRDHLAEAVCGHPVADVRGAWERMRRALRNLGVAGVGGQAVSAVDVALWDLQARRSGRPLAELFGTTRGTVPVYGSGGFTSLDDAGLTAAVDGWRAVGCRAMKIKVGESWGSRPDRDLSRVRRLRELAGDGVDLMVDANGGYDRGQARRLGAAFDELGVVWFEEPVSSDDRDGLAAVRAAVRCDVAAGEYVATRYGAQALCPVVDCLQLDVTRCGGYTGWLEGAAVAAAAGLDVSAHCAPALHAPVAAAVANLRHLEWFADHVRLEPRLVAGVPAVADGLLDVPLDRPGHGMSLLPEAERFRIDG